MDRYWQANAVEDAPETPADNPGGFPANGNPAAGVTGTVPGEWWYHAITEELRNAIIALGGTPDFTQVNQLADVLVDSFAKTVSTITDSLATVATTGSYHDLTDQPLIPAAQVNADWNAETGVAAILNRPEIPQPTRGSTLLAVTVYSVVEQSVTFSAGSPVINCSHRAPLTGSPVTFDSTDTLPANITRGTTYAVVQVSIDQSTFQIASVQGDTISMTDVGTGTHSIANPPWRKSDHRPAMVETALQGGGGSGGVASRTSNAGTATGGGAGGYVWLRRSADSLPDELDIGIGEGGTVPASGNAGSPGYLTHLGDLRSPLAVATGGAGGSGSATNAVLLGAPGGTGSGGDLNLRGEGSLPVVSTTASNYTAGGRSMFGTAGMGGVYGPSGATPVHDATGRGAGGGGGTGLPGSYNAGNGSDGLLIMREYS
ncbi:hypothetical protein F6X37_35110 [Paraburkholderia sp. 31.1]|uniref:glycine-rich domain-containing protein n=1 Tax=Paraburkholderia sp. 31.1 TaxID=2615205 RepID=UPI001655EE78|nr:hypothetical protein [Paraburkholderia sp. 31.1]MBC8726551.1 hypothetical protein [Paraburkholderia sp. 31.1]